MTLFYIPSLNRIAACCAKNNPAQFTINVSELIDLLCLYAVPVCCACMLCQYAVPVCRACMLWCVCMLCMYDVPVYFFLLYAVMCLYSVFVCFHAGNSKAATCKIDEGQ